jgi:hypothetical protein
MAQRVRSQPPRNRNFANQKAADSRVEGIAIRVPVKASSKA